MLNNHLQAGIAMESGNGAGESGTNSTSGNEPTAVSKRKQNALSFFVAEHFTASISVFSS